ncbi:MAG: GerW family sporulation protein [Clostridia bacterium]
MEKRAIESIMASTMESIRDMVDVNTVIGDPVVAADGSTVIPVSKVCFGFVAGGGEYNCGTPKKSMGEAPEQGELPFAGGSGAGVSVQPMGFLVVNDGQVRLLPAQYYAPVDRIIEMAPQLLNDVKNWISGMVDKKKDGPSELN